MKCTIIQPPNWKTLHPHKTTKYRTHNPWEPKLIYKHFHYPNPPLPGCVHEVLLVRVVSMMIERNEKNIAKGGCSVKVMDEVGMHALR